MKLRKFKKIKYEQIKYNFEVIKLKKQIALQFLNDLYIKDSIGERKFFNGNINNLKFKFKKI